MDATEPKRRIDWVSAVMALITSVALAWTAWLWLEQDGRTEPPAMGSKMPALRLLDLETAEPLVLVGLRGKVLWISFWSEAKPPDLAALQAASASLRSRKKFALIVAATDAGSTDRFRRVIAEAKVELPVYLASPETTRRFGAERRETPLHVLVDQFGHVGAVAQGLGPETLGRLAHHAQEWLDELEPPTNSRFAVDGWDTLESQFGNEVTYRTNRSVSREGGPWPKQMSAGSSLASFLADSRLRAGSIVKIRWGS